MTIRIKLLTALVITAIIGVAVASAIWNPPIPDLYQFVKIEL